MYPEELVIPMRLDLTEAGVQELKTADAVDNFMQETKGTALLIVNSV
ncbi:MAG TPA: BrxA/BrxB family bacilliredoxin, partial [Microscillaceae bacterium]|nr:BrxA/BrxB family bacilliredoxin [Microscillaceae bacterium]